MGHVKYLNVNKWQIYEDILKRIPVVQSFTMHQFLLQNTTKITTNYFDHKVDHKTMTFAREKVPYFIIVALFFLSFSDRNKIPPTTPRVKFPDRLVLKGN